MTSGSAVRSLDALHIALAIDACAPTMVTFDSRLAKVTRGQHLFVAPGTAADVEGGADRSEGARRTGAARRRLGPRRDPLRYSETHCTGADENKREPTRLLPTETLKKRNKQKPT